MPTLEIDQDEMIAQLKYMGWTRRAKRIWVSPWGKYFIGARDAWDAMRDAELKHG